MKYSDKIERLKELKKEVQDFHPFLLELFKRMQEFERVEYTQGNNEYGADFVLESKGRFNQVVYTGIIVKTGTIKQDLSAIREQINECFTISRLFKNGEKKITISEVFVITNEKITQNAKNKINQEFSLRNISFLDKEDLINLTDEYFSEYWEDTRINLNGFLDIQEKTAKDLCIGNILNFDSDETYVELNITKKDIKNKKVRISDFRKTDSLFNAIKISNPILLEGNMGSGKSVLIAKNTLKYIEEFKENKTGYLPLIIKFANIQDNPIEAINEEINKNLKLIESEYPNPEFVIFLDGFDEFDLSLNERRSFIQKLYKLVIHYNSYRFVMTTRNIEDYEFEIFLESYFEQYLVCPLKHSQILTIVKSFYFSEKIGTQIAESNLFQMLPKTPITAILLGQILKSDPQEIPSTLTELYSKFMEIVLSRWDANDYRSITEYQVLQNICGRFAYYILENSLSVISISELKDMIHTYLIERNIPISKTEVCNKILGNQEIFKVNYEKGLISFRHRSFGEYFYAHHIHKNNLAEITQEIYSPYWQNSYFFFFGLIKDSSDLLQKLESIHFDRFNYGLKIFQVIANAELLLAAYMTPYKDIEKQVNHSLTVASNTTLELIGDANQIKHLEKLNMSKFDMIMLMTVIVSKCYNYEFYDKALTSIADEILTITNEFSDSDWLKVFFVTSTLAERGNTDYIEYIAKEYNEKRIKLDNNKIKILFNIISNSNLNLNSDIKKFLRTYQKSFNKGSTVSQKITKLIRHNSSNQNKS